ncbi:MAG TPA: hypothetical protein PKE64_30305 [Anaerolineae bacterium]|nr:hypothetical protein [Anaerolineae bacterium]HMR68325.1 hypothetical protein [Anaerolineae bacterium]
MKLLIALGRKFVLTLFVLWVGGIAPLAYFTFFAFDHFVTPSRFALFEQLLAAPSQMLVSLAPTAVEPLLLRLQARFEGDVRGSLPLLARFDLINSCYFLDDWLSSSGHRV